MFEIAVWIIGFILVGLLVVATASLQALHDIRSLLASRSTPSTASTPSTKSASPLPTRTELLSRQIDRQKF